MWGGGAAERGSWNSGIVTEYGIALIPCLKFMEILDRARKIDKRWNTELILTEIYYNELMLSQLKNFIYTNHNPNKVEIQIERKYGNQS